MISILLAPGATWNTIVRPSSRRMDVFSVMSGRRMTSVSFIAALQLAACSLLQLLDARRGRDDHAVGVHDVARGDARARARAARRRCCAPTAPASRRAARRSSSALPLTPSRFSISTARLRLDLGGRQRVDDDERAVLHLLRERRAQRAALDLLRQRVVVAARLRPEHRAAMAPQRVADRRRRARGRCPSAATASCRCR